MNRIAFLLAGCIGVLLATASVTLAQDAAQRTDQVRAQAEATAADHLQMMRQLGIETLRPAADSRATAGPTAPNYDESRATPYPDLPEALRFRDGRPVRSVADWRRRRLEILEDFDREVYGRVPANLPAVRWSVVSQAVGEEGGVAVLRKTLHGVVERPDSPASPVTLELELGTPAGSTRRVPVMLELGFVGASPFATTPPAGQKGWKQQLLERGWGYAVIAPRSIQADNGAGLVRGIIGLGTRGLPRKVDDWGALRAWAWGASRALDYLQRDAQVDGRRVGVEGLSRYGKAALVAMAYDERFSIGFIASSGAGGAKLHRRDFGERVENLASPGAYHWMAGNYLKYAGPLTPADLPVDAHELIALCAPRPVFISAGAAEVEGGWIDARGMFLAAAAAGPVYRLLGRKDLGTSAFPPMLTPLVSGDLAFRQHDGGHTAGPNWPTFLDYASRYWTDNGKGR
jgi:hypothetical protein